jgi:transcriptional regulator with XRE-family HTH domain
MPTDLTFGQRLRLHRERAGKTRAVLGGLVGRSAEWVKALENDRLLTPRLPMLLRLAEVLGVTNLADLTGDQSIPVASVTKAAHPAALLVADAMSRAVFPAAADPATAHVSERVAHAWRLWHGSHTETSAVATVLPDLIRDAHAVTYVLSGPARRRALAELAQVYHLAQLFFAFQPATEMVWMAAERAMAAARESEDPKAVAGAAWYYAHAYRASNRLDAAEEVTARTAELLDPASNDDDERACWGQLHLGAALAHAKAGRTGQTLRHLDLATEAVHALGPGYVHPWLTFGAFCLDEFAVAASVDLFRAGEAVSRGMAADHAATPSRAHRAALLLNVAEAYHQQREPVAVLGTLNRAARASIDTVRRRPFARQVLLDLVEHRGPLRDGARDLALAVGVLK